MKLSNVIWPEISAVRIQLIIKLNAYIAQIAHRHNHRNIFICLRMTDTGGKEEVVTLYLVEHQTLQNTCFPIIVIQQTLKSSLGE